MAKIILEFDPFEEEQELEAALHGNRWKLVVQGILEKLRGTTKYNASILDDRKEASGLEIEVSEKYTEFIYSLLHAHNVYID